MRLRLWLARKLCPPGYVLQRTLVVTLTSTSGAPVVTKGGTGGGVFYFRNGTWQECS